MFFFQIGTLQQFGGGMSMGMGMNMDMGGLDESCDLKKTVKINFMKWNLIKIYVINGLSMKDLRYAFLLNVWKRGFSGQ